MNKHFCEQSTWMAISTWKLPNIISHEGNANQNLSETLLHTLHDGCFKKKTENNKRRGFPGGPVVKNLPCNARDTALGLITGLGRSHVLWGNWAHVPQLMSLHSEACELKLLSPHTTAAGACVPGACAPQEKPQQQETQALQLEELPLSTTRESPWAARSRRQKSNK